MDPMEYKKNASPYETYLSCTAGRTAWFILPERLSLHQPRVDNYGTKLFSPNVDGIFWALGFETKPTLGVVAT